MCNWFAQWIHSQDRKHQCYFVAQQDRIAHSIFPRHLLTSPPTTVIVRLQEARKSRYEFLHESEAVLAILQRLQPRNIWWPLLKLIPKSSEMSPIDG